MRDEVGLSIGIGEHSVDANVTRQGAGRCVCRHGGRWHRQSAGGEDGRGGRVAASGMYDAWLCAYSDVLAQGSFLLSFWTG